MEDQSCRTTRREQRRDFLHVGDFSASEVGFQSPFQEGEGSGLRLKEEDLRQAVSDLVGGKASGQTGSMVTAVP